jgi:uncharacterized protein (DUF849 family)
VLGGIGADPENLMHMKRMADKLFGEDYMFSVLAAGRQQIPFATHLGGDGRHVRVGLEDSLFIARGELARLQRRAGRKIRRILEEMGREIATPDEARAMLGLKGADKVAL